ncbi:hypothetical protein [Parabacteroides goldsteinii]|uniref:hypothetical protein n=1 Tax=Parabacteroides goldsteinii TaxID=328812 RepID=UPI0022E5F002|nr:hypothetical protein [Parabacteroides goldsteinii]
MKHLFCILFVAMISVSAFAQEKKVYCEIVGDGNFKGDKVKIEIVFGENIDDAIKPQADKIKTVKFSTMVDALNYMAKQGWKLEQTYAIPETSGMNRGSIFHYILSTQI